MDDEIKELDKEWTLDFIQSYHEENDGLIKLNNSYVLS